MSELRGWLDDRDEAEVQKLFNTFYEVDKPSADLDDRLARLVLSEVRTVFATPSEVAAPVAPRRSRQRPGLIARLRAWLGNLAPSQSLALAGAGALAMLLLYFGISRITPRPLLATATVTGGEVTVLQQRTNTYRTYYDGDLFKLAEGDQVLTANGTTTVQLFPAQTAVLEPDSHVVISQLDAMLETTLVELLVTRGRVNNLIDEELDNGDRYVVTSSVIEASVTGTEFSFETVSATEVIVQTKRGAVAVTQADQTVVVSEGEQVATLEGAPLIVEPSHERLDRPTLLVIAPGMPGIPVFAEPNAQARMIGYAADGVLLRVLGVDESGAWYQICCVGQETGWLEVAAIPTALIETNAAEAAQDTRRSRDEVAAANMMPIASPGATPTLTATPSPTVIPAPTMTASATPQPSATATASASPTPSRTATPLSSPTPTATRTPPPSTTPSQTVTPPSPTALPTATSTALPTATASYTPSPRPTDEDDDEKEATPTPTMTPEPPTATATEVASATPTHTATRAPTATATATLLPQIVTPTPTADVGGQATATDTPTSPPPPPPTLVIVPTATPTPEPPPTATPTPPPTPTNTPTPEPTPTNTLMPEPTPTNTLMPEPTPTDTPTTEPPPPTVVPPPPSPQPAGDPAQPDPVAPPVTATPLPEGNAEQLNTNP